MKKHLSLITLIAGFFCFYANTVEAQTGGVTVGSNTPPDAASILDVISTTKGISFPQVALATTTSLPAGSSPKEGTVIYNTNAAITGVTANGKGLYYWDSAKWVWVKGQTGVEQAPWLTAGNAGTDTTQNFVGTTDNKSLMFRINNTPSGTLSQLNTAFGYRSFMGTVTGADNTAVGDSALASGVHSYDNTAIGHHALSKTSAGANTALGSLALPSNTTGGWNNAIGYLTMYSNTTGMRNNAIGSGALLQNTAGGENTAIGFNALSQNTVASYNAAIGNNALQNNTSGASNVAIGYNAGVTTTTGGYNILLGSSDTLVNQVRASAPGASNELNIGNTLYGTGVNNAPAGNRGKIGINTNNPLATLHVKGTARVDTLPVGAVTDSVVTADINGNLHKRAAADMVHNNAWALNGNTGTNSVTNFLGTADNVSLRFRTNNAERMVVDSVGNIGIGNNMPGARLDISNQGSATMAALKLRAPFHGQVSDSILTWDPADSSVRMIAASSLKGSNPWYSTVTNTGALNNTDSVYIMGRAIIGSNIPATVASATSGSSPLKQTAYFTVAGGDASINGLTVGRGGGQSNTNVAVGYQSLYNNTSAAYNVALGWNALYNNNGSTGVKGYGNIAAGAQALYSNTDGDNNIAIGSTALKVNTTGIHNMAVGGNSLYSNISGSYNVAMGGSSLFMNTGNNNVSMGEQAFNSKAAGDNNIALGHMAGNLQTSGSNNIVIGSSINLPSVTGSNQLNIGNSIYGTGLYSATSRIGINTNNPLATFHVKGTARIDTLPVGTVTDSVVTADASGNLHKRDASSLAGNDWKTTGNSGTLSTTNFLGTTDNVSLRIRTNNTEWAVIDSTGKMGISTTAPTASLDVNGGVRVRNLPVGVATDSVVTADANGNLRKVGNLKIMNVAYVAPSATTTYSTDTLDMIMVNPNADNIATVNLPASTTRVVGTVITIKNAAAAGLNVLTIKSQGTDTIDDPTGTNNTFGPVGGGASVQFVLTDTGAKKVWFSIANR